MSKHVKQVIDLSQEILDQSDTALTYNCPEGVTEVVSEMGEVKSSSGTWGTPKVFMNAIENENHLHKLTIFYELMASAVNYCYWYGGGDIRPNGSGSTLMYKMLDNAFSSVSCTTWIYPDIFWEGGILEIIDEFRNQICLSHMPMIKERVEHIEQIRETHNQYSGIAWLATQCLPTDEKPESNRVDTILNVLLAQFPSFAEDLFMKRAFLFLMQVNRRIGIFDDFIDIIPVPSDYQVPKMLEHFGCIRYGQKLGNKIRNGELIPKGSIEECTIRAATIMTCRHIAKVAGCSMDAVDNFLWCKRKECDSPFHLTVTTDY